MPSPWRVVQLTLMLTWLAVGASWALAPQDTPVDTTKRILVHSDTVYMNAETMARALRREPEFRELKLALSDNRLQADLYVEIKRVLFTWDWTYALTDIRTGREVSKGKVTAATAERAANGLAPLIMKAIAAMVPVPATATATTKPAETAPPKPAEDENAALERELASAPIVVENVDTPPATGAVNPHAYALVIAVEAYRAPIPEVPFALRDAAVMKRYFESALGLPASNIKGLPNPALTDLKVGLTWLRNQMLADNSPDAFAYVYYAGHGVPDTRGKPYLMPVDANPAYIAETGFALESLLAELSALPGHTLVLLDACFTGAAARATGSSAGVLMGKRPAFVDAPLPSQARVAVLSAVTGPQTSNALPAARHGLFTYYLLKGLRGDAADAQGRVTLASLQQYVTKAVSDAAGRMNQSQTPSLSGPTELLLLKLPK